MGKHGKRITRRGIQITLGLFWLLDGALQLQHQMFTSSFTTNIIAPAAQGQPIFVSGAMHFAISIFLTHPAIFNSLIAIIQLGLGILILLPRTVKYGLAASVIWGLIVWYIGEGLGGLASGHTLLLMGAPGAALLYVLIALAVLPTNHKKDEAQPAYWLVIIWAAFWIVGAVYQLLPGQNTIADLSSMVTGMGNGAPGWLASLDDHTASLINSIGGSSSAQMSAMHMSTSQMASMPIHHDSGFWFILLLAAMQLLIGVTALVRGYTRKISIGLGIIISLVFWVIGQSLGGYYTGLATDPSTAPLFILLGVAVLGCPEVSFKELGLYSKRSLERLLT